jgi:hypothetical protein
METKSPYPPFVEAYPEKNSRNYVENRFTVIVTIMPYVGLLLLALHVDYTCTTRGGSSLVPWYEQSTERLALNRCTCSRADLHSASARKTMCEPR